MPPCLTAQSTFLSTRHTSGIPFILFIRTMSIIKSTKRGFEQAYRGFEQACWRAGYVTTVALWVVSVIVALAVYGYGVFVVYPWPSTVITFEGLLQGFVGVVLSVGGLAAIAFFNRGWSRECRRAKKRLDPDYRAELIAKAIADPPSIKRIAMGVLVGILILAVVLVRCVGT
jgi:hypothetical protein